MDEVDVGKGGGDAILNWLKANSAALRSRAAAAPVFVLRDWEDGKVAQFDNALQPHGWSKALKCPEALANPDLDSSWKGIERYLSTDLVRASIPELLLAAPGGSLPLSILPTNLGTAKQRLVKAFRDAPADPGTYLVNLAGWLDDEIVGAMNAIPVAEFITQ
jgi:hypothetical protein